MRFEPLRHVAPWVGMLVLVATHAVAQPAPAPAASPSAPAPPPPPPPPPPAPAPAPAPAPTPAPAPAQPPTSFNDTRPAASGFQLAFRTGVTAPFGTASGAANDSLAHRYAWQIPLVIDIGARFSRSFFLGAYLGGALGSTGSDERVDAACIDDDENGRNDIACTSTSGRIGLEVLYSFQPDDSLNPWIGYGIGFEVASASIRDDYHGLTETVTSTGFTFADISAGLDFRKRVGVGPFVDVALGQFNNTTTDLGARGAYKYNIEDHAVHGWLTIGLRLVVNP